MLKVASRKGCGLCMTVKAMLKKKKEAYFEYDVESEHIGRNTIYNMNQIEKLRRSFPTSVDAFFNDSNKNYWLSYSLLFKDRINLYTSNIIHKEESKKPTL